VDEVLIAKVAHEINRAYCESIGEEGQVSWEEAPEWQKRSALNGVEFHIENPEATPENSHETWLKEKLEAGWQYGQVKDVGKKEHPCCVDYFSLPLEQRSKDYLFRSVVHTLLDIGV